MKESYIKYILIIVEFDNLVEVLFIFFRKFYNRRVIVYISNKFFFRRVDYFVKF